MEYYSQALVFSADENTNIREGQEVLKAELDLPVQRVEEFDWSYAALRAAIEGQGYREEDWAQLLPPGTNGGVETWVVCTAYGRVWYQAGVWYVDLDGEYDWERLKPYFAS